MPKRKTIEEVREILLQDKEYEIIEPLIYKNMQESTIHMKHKLCNCEFSVCLQRWMIGQRPHRCSVHKSTLRKTTEYFKQEVKQCDNSEDYEVIGEYVNKRTKIEMKHISKNHNFFISPEDFLDGCRCNICFQTHLKTTDEFKKEAQQVDSNYEVVGQYTSALKKIEMKHLKCGKTFFTKPNDFLNGHGCPYCNEPRNEKRIEKVLNDNQIIYEKQKIFNDCRDKLPLRFDFYIPSKNTCIEYDGEFHFINCIEGVDTLTAQQRRDQIKTKYCEEHNIKLIRISYKEKDKIDKLIQLLS